MMHSEQSYLEISKHFMGLLIGKGADLRGAAIQALDATDVLLEERAKRLGGTDPVRVLSEASGERAYTKAKGEETKEPLRVDGGQAVSAPSLEERLSAAGLSEMFSPENVAGGKLKSTVSNWVFGELIEKGYVRQPALAMILAQIGVLVPGATSGKDLEKLTDFMQLALWASEITPLEREEPFDTPVSNEVAPVTSPPVAAPTLDTPPWEELGAAVNLDAEITNLLDDCSASEELTNEAFHIVQKTGYGAAGDDAPDAVKRDCLDLLRKLWNDNEEN